MRAIRKGRPSPARQNRAARAEAFIDDIQKRLTVLVERAPASFWFRLLLCTSLATVFVCESLPSAGRWVPGYSPLCRPRCTVRRWRRCASRSVGVWAGLLRLSPALLGGEAVRGWSRLHQYLLTSGPKIFTPRQPYRVVDPVREWQQTTPPTAGAKGQDSSSFKPVRLENVEYFNDRQCCLLGLTRSPSAAARRDVRVLS
jgi:hypothetical protein